MYQENGVPQLLRDRSSHTQNPYNKLVNISSVSLTSVSHYSKLSNLRRELWEPLICSQVGQKCGHHILVIEMERSLVGQSPMGSSLTSGSQCHNLIKLQDIQLVFSENRRIVSCWKPTDLVSEVHEQKQFSFEVWYMDNDKPRRAQKAIQQWNWEWSDRW